MGVAVADLSNVQLLGAVRGVQKHAGHGRAAGREWRERDTATMAELARRSWNWAVLEGLKALALPRCVENLCEHLSATGRRMHRAAYRPLLAAVCGAYRAGRMGVRLSFEQIAVMLGTSRRTAARMVSEMLALRIIRRDHTYVCDEGGTERAFDTSVYAVGGRTLEVARGGLDSGPDAARWAAAARARARSERRARYIALWNAQRGTRGPSFADEWLHGPAPVAVSSRGSVNVAPTPRKQGGHEQWGPPHCGESKVGGRSLPSATAPLQTAGAPETRQEPGASMLATSAPEETGNPTSWAQRARDLLFS